MSYKECEVEKKRVKGRVADYKLKCNKSDGSSVEICVTGQSINEPTVLTLCKQGELDNMSSCDDWE